MGSPPASAEQLDAIERRIDEWLAAAGGAIESVERGEAGTRRWYVRLRGEDKDVWAIWFTLGQRTLRYETYLLPAPRRNHAAFYEHLLRRNRSLRGVAFEIGPEDAVFLAGALPLAHLDAAALDAVIGAMYGGVELAFRSALEIGFS